MAFNRQLFQSKNFIVETRLGSKHVSDTVYSKVIWHAYRSIAETKIFRLDVSLMCPLYVKKEDWFGKKLYYRKIKYITSNTKNFKVHLQ